MATPVRCRSTFWGFWVRSSAPKQVVLWIYAQNSALCYLFDVIQPFTSQKAALAQKSTKHIAEMNTNKWKSSGEMYWHVLDRRLVKNVRLFSVYASPCVIHSTTAWWGTWITAPLKNEWFNRCPQWVRHLKSHATRKDPDFCRRKIPGEDECGTPGQPHAMIYLDETLSLFYVLVAPSKMEQMSQGFHQSH